jgi:hypothetical protein
MDGIKTTPAKKNELSKPSASAQNIKVIVVDYKAGEYEKKWHHEVSVADYVYAVHGPEYWRHVHQDDKKRRYTAHCLQAAKEFIFVIYCQVSPSPSSITNAF